MKNTPAGTIIYLHGFMSVGDTPKSQALKQAFGDANVISIDLPIRPNDVIKAIDKIVRQVKVFPVVFVGTSLGGFYANYFAQKYDCPGILVNPATVPSKTLYRAIGYNKNHKTGKDILWTLEDVEQLAAMEREVSTIHSGGLVNLFVARDDEVVSPDETLGNYPYTVSTKVYDTGGHRFEDNWDDVVERVREVLS